MDTKILRIKKDFDDFERNVERMESLKKRLSQLTTTGFEAEVTRINNLSREVENVNKVEHLINGLIHQIHKKRYSDRLREEKNKIRLKVEESVIKRGHRLKLRALGERIKTFRMKRNAIKTLKANSEIGQKISELEAKKSVVVKKLRTIETAFNSGFISKPAYNKSRHGLKTIIKGIETEIISLKKRRK